MAPRKERQRTDSDGHSAPTGLNCSAYNEAMPAGSTNMGIWLKETANATGSID